MTNDSAESTRPIPQRIAELNRKLDESEIDELSDEEIEELKQEYREISEIMNGIFDPLKEATRSYLTQYVEAMQPLVELAEEIEVDDER